MTLATMPLRTSGVIHDLVEHDEHQIIHRLGELGFIPGEPVMIVARNAGGIAVQIGDSMFALNTTEAKCIRVNEIISFREVGLNNIDRREV